MNNKRPETMKALVLPKPGEYRVMEVPVPEIKPDEVLCRIKAVAICGSDPEVIRGDLAGFWPPEYPFIPGHEWSGEVTAVGKDVINFKPGDRVAGEAHKGCGVCPTCLQGRYNICDNYGKTDTPHRHYGFVHQGAYAQYNAYSEKSLNRITDKISYKEAALVDTSGVVAHGLEQTGITLGGTCLIIGPGPIGLITMRMAKLMGAAKVIVVGRRKRLEISKALGADAVIDFEKEDPVEAVKRITSGKGVDEAFECSGAPGTFRQVVESVKRGGRVGLLGVPEGDVNEAIPFGYTVSNEIAIFGSKANPNVSKKIISLLDSGQLVLKDLVSHTYPLEQFPEALDTFVQRKDGAMKVVIFPNGMEGESIGFKGN